MIDIWPVLCLVFNVHSGISRVSKDMVPANAIFREIERWVACLDKFDDIVHLRRKAILKHLGPLRRRLY